MIFWSHIYKVTKLEKLNDMLKYYVDLLKLFKARIISNFMELNEEALNIKFQGINNYNRKKIVGNSFLLILISK